MSAKVVNWAAWRFGIRPRLKRLLTENTAMMDFMKGSKTKIGAFGAFLATVAAILVSLGQAPEINVQGLLDAARDLFLALGGFGGVMKLVRVMDKKENGG